MSGWGQYRDLEAARPEVLKGLRERLSRGAKRNEQTGCLEWQGPASSEGYGLLWSLARVWTVHRLTWMLENGEIPAGHLVCHHCDNRRCGEPGHLFLGTRAENVGDMLTKGRQKYRKPRQVAAEQQELIRILRGAGETFRDISARVGLPMWTVVRVCRDAGYGPSPESIVGRSGYRKWQPEWTQQAIEMQAAGKRLREIAEAFGVTAATVFQRVGRKKARGIGLWKPEYEARAVEMQKAGKPLREIAAELGLSVATVYQHVGSKRKYMMMAHDDPMGLKRKPKATGKPPDLDKDFDFGA